MIGDVTEKILKADMNTCLKDINIPINGYLEKGVSLDKLKLADVRSIFKKGDNQEKETIDLTVF